MSQVISHAAWHGEISRQEAVQRLSSRPKYLQPLYLIRSRDPRTNSQTGSPITISMSYHRE
jgi:hypothetical protein